MWQVAAVVHIVHLVPASPHERRADTDAAATRGLAPAPHSVILPWLQSIHFRAADAARRDIRPHAHTPKEAP